MKKFDALHEAIRKVITEQMVPALITHKHGVGSINVPDHPNFGSKEHIDVINKRYPDMPSGPVTKVERDTRKTKTPEEIGKEQIADRERNRYHGD